MARRTLLLAALLLLFGGVLYAQGPSGGVKGRIVSRLTKAAVEGARVSLLRDAFPLEEAASDGKGNFVFEGIPDGNYILVVTAPEYLENRLKVVVSGGRMKNVFNVTLSAVHHVADDAPEALFGSSDIYENISRYQFPFLRDNARGLGAASRSVYLAGVRLEETSSSLWAGLGESMLASAFQSGAGFSGTAFGGINGTVEVAGTASSFRPGLRGNVLSNGALYLLRSNLSYATGPLKGGWSLAADIGGRAFPQRENLPGRPAVWYLGVDKAFSATSKLSAAVFQAQDPVAFLRYDYTPSSRFRAYLTALGQLDGFRKGDLHLAGAFNWKLRERFVLSGGADGNIDRREGREQDRVEAWLGSEYTVRRVNILAAVRLGDVHRQGHHRHTYAAKAGVNYLWGANTRAYANLGFFQDAPLEVEGEAPRTFSSDINWSYNSNGINIRATAYYLARLNRDSYCAGAEIGLKLPVLIIPNLSLQGLLCAGVYGADPVMPPLVASAGLSWSNKAWFVDADMQDVDGLFMVNLSAGKSWMLGGGRHLLGLSAAVRNLLNNAGTTETVSLVLPPLHYLVKLYFKI